MNPYVFDAVRLLSVPILVALNAFFVACEFALVTVRWTRVEQLIEEKKFGAIAVREAIERLDNAIAATQLGVTIASLGLGWIGEPALAHLLEPLAHRVPWPWNFAILHGIAVAIAFAGITYLHVVLGELVPKALALERAEDVALFLAPPLNVFARTVRPFIRIMRGTANAVVRSLKLPPLKEHQMVHSVDELSMLVEETQEAGQIADDQATYVQRVFELSDKTVGDVMVPRDKVITLPLSASEDEVLQTARDTAHTRMPVWDGTPDNVVGIVNTKDLFHLFSLKGLVILMDAMYPPLFVQPDMTLSSMLRIFRRERRPMAIVRNISDNKFCGIVTLEDILEEIVGEIEDEHDVRLPHGMVRKPAVPAPAKHGGAPGAHGAAPSTPPRP
jgi:CBS domain containing-hemolysin-like protein